MEAIQGITQADMEKDTEEIFKGYSSFVNGTDEQQIVPELIRELEDFELLREEWDKLLEESEAHIFQSFEWQYIWWHHFGDDRPLNILAFRKEGELVGLAPFFLDDTSLWGEQTFLKLRFIGCSIPGGEAIGTFADYSPTDYLDVIAHSEYKDEVARALLNYLEQTWNQFDQIDFDEIPEDGIIHEHLIPKMKERGWSFKKKRKEVCPYITYPDSMEDYLLDLDRKARYELRYSKRAVTEKELFSVYEAKNDEEIEKVFADFVALHQERWNKQGMPGAFADQRYARFLKDIARVFNQRGWLRLTTAIDNDDSCIAVDFAFAFKNCTYDYQKAFDYDSPLAKYSPGRALMYFLMEEAIENDRSVFELLRGGEKYKFRVANDSKYNWKITIPSPSKKKGLKYRIYEMYTLFSNVKRRLGREKLIMKVHLQEWGIPGFASKYISFLYERVNDKLS